MEGADRELERRSNFLSSLIQKKKAEAQNDRLNIRVRASDMPLLLQNRAFRCARDHLDSTVGRKLDSKRLALTLKKVTIRFLLGLFELQLSYFTIQFLLGLFELQPSYFTILVSGF